MDLAAQNRLGIPLLVGEDGIHGHSFWKGSTIFPTQLALAASWNPELRRAGRPRDGRGDGADRDPLVVRARALPDARPALGPHRRDLRRGPVPDRRARRRAHPRLPGQGPRRPGGRARHRQALRGLLRDPGRPRRLRGRHHAPQAAQLLPAALRAGRARRRDDVHDRLPVDGRRAVDRQPLAAHRRAQERVGLPRRARDRLGQRRPPRARAEGRRDLRRRRDHGAARRQRHHHDHPAVLRGRHRGRAQRPPRRVGDRRPGAPAAGAEVPHGPVREPAASRPRARRRRGRAGRPPRREPRRRAPEPRPAAERRARPARPGEVQVHRRDRPERRRRPAAARRLVARLAPAPAGGRQAPAREDDDRARRHPRAGAGRCDRPPRARLLDRRRRSLRHPRRGRRRTGRRRGRGRRGRPPELHRRGEEHRHSRAAGRTGGARSMRWRRRASR